jgi:flagellar basal-body rod protein FlgB
MNLDNAFGIHAQALVFRAQRAKVLAGNLANAETPNYKARDIDFKEAMQVATESRTELQRSHPGHLSGVDLDIMGAEAKYRNPQQPSIDGNTVDAHIEQAEFAKNAMQYQASLRFLSGRISGLLTALKGE